jgi:hypothetical protein
LAAHPPGWPAGTGAHVPLAHVVQGPAQELLQQKLPSPEEQIPLAQSAPPLAGLHAALLLPAHAPAALQV